MPKPDPIFWWWTTNSKHDGFYKVLLLPDGSMSCPCSGWTIQRKDKRTGEPIPRNCSHLRKNAEDAIKLFQKYRRGEKLPTPPERPAMLGAALPPSALHSGANRLYQFDDE